MTTHPADNTLTQKEANAALFDAISAGELVGIQQAITDGADISARKGDGLTPCTHLAINSQGGDRYDTLKLVLDLGVDPDIANRRGFTAVHSLANGNQADLLNLMLDYGANPNTYTLSGSTPPFNETPLHEAASKNRIDVVEPLLKAGSDPLLQDKNGNNVMQRISTEWPQPREVVAKYMDLPRIAVTDDLCVADLLPTGDGTLCPLDNPVTWRQWPQIEEILSKNGESLSKDDLQQHGWEGRSYLSRATEARQLAPVIEHLNQHDEFLSVADIKASDDVLAEGLSASYLPKQIFTFDNLALQGATGFTENLAALPQEGRENLQGKHGLAAKLRNHHTQASSVTR